MTRRQQRMLFVAVIVAGVALAVALFLRAMDENLLYYYSPTQVLRGEVPDNQMFRLGGLVVEGSVRRTPGTLTVSFSLTDTQSTVPVLYTGILPDLFREGQGIVAHGTLQGGVFQADEVLAKHDENYMPPDVADSIKQAHAEGVARKAAQAKQAGQK